MIAQADATRRGPGEYSATVYSWRVGVDMGADAERGGDR